MTDDRNGPPKSPFSPAFVKSGDTPPPEPPHRPSDQQTPQDPDGNPSPNRQEVRDLRTAQNLIMVGSVAGPVSLFFGGVLLSGAGALCAFLGLRKLNVLSKRGTDISMFALRIRRSAFIALAICGIAFILNAISFAIMYPVVLQAVETGDYGSLIPNAGNGGTGSSGTNSTWG